MSKPTPSARPKDRNVPQRSAGDSTGRKPKANEGTENPKVMYPQSMSQTTEFAVTKSGRKLRAPEASTTQDSKTCSQQRRAGSAKPRDEAAEATSEMPETMPVKSRSKQSDWAPGHKKEEKVPQGKARGGRGKGVEDEERIEDSATASILSPLAPEQLSAHGPHPKQTGAAQRRRQPTEATSEMPETMPVKSRSKQSDWAPEHKKEEKVPQGKARGGRGKGAEDEERIEDSATASILSPLAPEQLSAHGPHPKQTGAAQRRRQPTGHLGQHNSKSTSAGLCESSEMAAAALAVQSQDAVLRIKERVKALPLKHEEIIKAAGIINGFIDPFISYLKECPEKPYFKEVIKLNTGSYYECLKIAHPDEFDVMLALPVPESVKYQKVDDCNGLYYKVTLLRRSRSFPTPFLLEDGSTVSPVIILKELRQRVSQFIASCYKVPFPRWKMKLRRKKPNSPAVTVELLDDKEVEVMSVDLVPALEISTPWPDSCGLGKDVEKWLGKKTKPRNRSFYFVAKQPHGQDDKEVWRISFSHIEKEILNNHGNTKTCCESYNTKCCRKTCIRLMKSLFEALKKDYPRQLSHLCSYYAKMSFFHTLTQWKEDSDWKPSDITCCFLRVLGDFIQHLEKANLPHFFIPNCNLFYSFPPKDLKFLLELLREQKRNGLQAFAVHEK